ncbi:MAG: glycosyltransferase family 4 protein [Candidatus Promineifilaceae bacterium]|jgi:glycosyltransferase involved in cell wall biosynthesis
MPGEDSFQLENNKTRIGINAHLLSSELDFRRAGIHHYIAQVINHLPRLNDQTEYLIYTRDRTTIDDLTGSRIVSSRWPTEQRLFRILWEQSAWPFHAAREGLDLLHSMAFVTPFVTRIPSIVTVYDLSFVHYPDKFPILQRQYLQTQTARSVNQARRVITISEATRQDLYNYFNVPLEKTSVVYPGVDAHFRQIPEKSLNAFRVQNNLYKPFILHVGTLQPRKNIPALLIAFAALENQDIDLVLAGGKGWFYDEIFNQVNNLGLTDRVHFTGYVRDEELPFWYNAAKVLVFPSVYEGFGMPIIEAMACGTPVIAARSSSIPEAGGETALYFEPHDVEKLTQQLAEIIEDKNLLLKMRQSGLMQARKFAWNQAGVETAQVYAQVLADR